MCLSKYYVQVERCLSDEKNIQIIRKICMIKHIFKFKIKIISLKSNDRIIIFHKIFTSWFNLCMRDNYQNSSNNRKK